MDPTGFAAAFLLSREPRPKAEKPPPPAAVKASKLVRFALFRPADPVLDRDLRPDLEPAPEPTPEPTPEPPPKDDPRLSMTGPTAGQLTDTVKEIVKEASTPHWSPQIQHEQDASAKRHTSTTQPVRPQSLRVKSTTPQPQAPITWALQDRFGTTWYGPDKARVEQWVAQRNMPQSTQPYTYQTYVSYSYPQRYTSTYTSCAGGSCH
jgi:hypothetical protein